MLEKELYLKRLFEISKKIEDSKTPEDSQKWFGYLQGYLKAGEVLIKLTPTKTKGEEYIKE